MTALTVEQILEDIFTSLQNDNEGIDEHIHSLKTAMADAGRKDIEIDAARLPHNNRQGRKLMQSYFKKRGVVISFLDKG